MPIRTVALVGLIASSLAWAGPEAKLLKKASQRFDEVGKTLKSAPAACRVIEPTVAVVKKNLAALQKKGQRTDVTLSRSELAELAWTAGLRDCPDAVIGHLLATSDLLELARLSWDSKRAVGDGTFAPLALNLNGVFEGEPSVIVSTSEFKLSPHPSRTFYFGARFKSAKGEWTEWVTTSAWSAPAQPLVWPNAFTHALRSSRLAEENVGNGRFFVRVSAFDDTGRELAFRDAFFLFGATAPLASPPPAPRDCGVKKDDPGCNTERNGHLPMDAMTFTAFLTAMRQALHDPARHDLIERMLPGQALTALQFGQVLDQFSNDATRIKAAKLAAPFVADLPRAVGFASKFEVTYFADEFTQLVVRGG